MAGALMIWDGSAWQVVSQQGPAGNNSLWVGPSAPPGTPVTGDEWFDTDEPNTGLSLPLSVANGGTGAASAPAARSTLQMPGEELAYNQITATVSITATGIATATPIIPATSRTYDGAPVIADFMAPSVLAPAGSVTVFNLLDGAIDLGYFASIAAPAAGQLYGTASPTRRFTPTAGTHAYSVVGWISGSGAGQCQAGTGTGPAVYGPAFLRITRA